MPRSGAVTREKIIDSAQALVYAHGFAATSIDKVIAGAGITKGAFFYHFKSKGDLGRALIQRYAERDLEHFDRTMARAKKLSGDPRQQVLIFVGLLQEDFEHLPDPIPGCLFTSYLYERTEYPEDVAEIAVQTFDQWRDRFAGKLREAFAARGSGTRPSAERLAETLLALIEGGFVLSKAKGTSQVLMDLLGAYRSNLEGILGMAEDREEPEDRGR